MELLLRVQTSNGSTRDVRVETDAEASIASLSRELADYLGMSAIQQDAVLLTRVPSGRRLDPDTTISASGLVSGEMLVVGNVDVAESEIFAVEEGKWHLDVLSGAEAGRSFVLEEGSYSFDSDPDPGTADHVGGWPHFDIEVHADGRATLLPPADKSVVAVDGVDVREPVELADLSLVRSGATYLALRRLGPREHYEFASGRKDRLGNVEFFRTPYRPAIVRDRELEALKDIPSSSEGRRFPFLSSLAPVAGGLAMYAFSQRIEFLVLTLLMPLVAVASWVEERRSTRKKYKKEAKRFRSEIPKYAQRLDNALDQERKERFAAAPDVIDLCRRAMSHSKDLWPRGRENEEFLRLRVGIGDAASHVKGSVAEQGDGELRREASAALVGSDSLADVPVVVELASLSGVAIHGEASGENLATSLVLQAATLHSPEDLVILGAVTPDRSLAEQLKWLPHTRTLTSPIAHRHVATDPDGARDLLRELVSLAVSRSEDTQDRRRMQHWPRLLVVLDETLELDPARVAQLLDDAPRSGISVLWLARSVARIPRQLDAIVDCEDAQTGRAELWFRDPEREGSRVVLETVGVEMVDIVVRSLAPLRDTSAKNLTTAIPKIVPLFSVLGFDAEDRVEGIAAKLMERWLATPDYALHTPLGLTSERVLQLDLVAQGPHVLIGGTSGSGKSEFLVAFVSGLIANYAPGRMNLLFIDYKGGAATEVFRSAPHTVGYVTNLSGELATRALVSLRAELESRMRLFEGRAKDIAEMIQRHPDEAPPSLIIVVDEFATLVKEIPEFVSGIVDIAQRGRSLGIHLVLATQSPSGSVDEKIQANTTSRIALRMVDVAESSAVIGSADAVHIPVPLRGRAIARLGPSEMVEFQSAYGGAPVDDNDGAEVLVGPFDTSGSAPARAGKLRVSDRDPVTQLDVFLQAVAAATDRLRLPPQRKPWRDELPDHLLLDDLVASAPVAAPHVVTIGRLDDPQRQEQPVASVDLEEGGGLLVFGSAGSGKTTVLRTVAASVVSVNADGEIVVLDFASGTLRELASLGVCTEVAAGDDIEAVTRVLAALESEVLRRKAVLGETHAETLSAHLAKGGERLSRVVLLVDGYTAMRETFQGYGSSASMQSWLDRFHKLVSDGRKVGIHAVITADRAAAVPAVLTSAIARKLVLRQSGEQGLVDLGVAASRAKGLDLAPGRGLLDARTIVQVACVSADGSGSSQTEAIRTLASVDVARAGDSLRTRALSEREHIPAVITQGRLDALLGLADVSCSPVTVDLEDGHLAVTGMSRSGRSNALATVAASLCSNDVHVYLAGTEVSGLQALAGQKRIARSSFDTTDDLVGMINELVELSDSWDLSRVLIVDDIDKITETPDLVAAWNRLAKCRRMRVVASLELRSIHTGYFQSDLLHQLKSGRRKLLLQPADDAEVQTVLGVRAPIRPGLAMPPGRGVLLADRDPVALHVGLHVPDVDIDLSGTGSTSNNYVENRNH